MASTHPLTAAGCTVGASYMICAIRCLRYSNEQSTSVYYHSKKDHLHALSVNKCILP